MRVWEGDVLRDPSAVAANIIAACKARRPLGGRTDPDPQ